ncbi:hypothetical protein BJ165DRAFT_1408566 [Panaeolus papilionaceus]|nr:hypothetical protein BJ165DRAFT_1408566 [Panaeolus papilionaceus]
MPNSSFYIPSSTPGSPAPSSPQPSQPIVESYTTDNECHCKNQLAHWDMNGNIHPNLPPGCRRALEMEGRLDETGDSDCASVDATVGSASENPSTNMKSAANNEGVEIHESDAEDTNTSSMQGSRIDDSVPSATSTSHKALAGDIASGNAGTVARWGVVGGKRGRSDDDGEREREKGDGVAAVHACKKKSRATAIPNISGRRELQSFEKDWVVVAANDKSLALKKSLGFDESEVACATVKGF